MDVSVWNKKQIEIQFLRKVEMADMKYPNLTIAIMKQQQWTYLVNMVIFATLFNSNFPTFCWFAAWGSKTVKTAVYLP